LLLPIKDTGTWNRFTTTVIGFAVNTIFPAKLGEIVRPYLLGTKENISKSAAFATIVIERIFDTICILLMLVIYLVFLVQPEQLSEGARSSLRELNRAGVTLFALILALALFLYYLKTKPAAVRAIIKRIEKRLPSKVAHSMDHLLDSFAEGLSILHDPIILLKIGAWSVSFWLIISVGFWFGVRAYLPNFAFSGTFLLLVLVAMGIAVPTPGGLGSYHLACMIGLTRFFGVSETQAGAIALMNHFITFVPVTIIGLIFLWREGLTASKIQEIGKEEEKIVMGDE
jgi:uncharacterized protein (TIRG00374 family)